VPRPKLVARKERWIRVDLDRQTLTAYEGDTPVFATLVSSGVAEHATPTGLFRVHAKHVATTMDDFAADGAYSIEDVPWTMYFMGSYALHAAFWHERFGNPRSHGCVNLSPRDARWLFFWSLPELPSGWHGVLAAVGKGTSVLVDTGVAYPVEQGG
jgi:lipoprotein-anchoring transpeptidase ErfK/SrfK